LALEVGISSRYLRRYDEAKRYFSMVISLAPDDYIGYAFAVELYRRALGDLQMAREVLESIPPALVDMTALQLAWVAMEVYDRRYGAALRRLESRASDDIRMTGKAYLPVILRKATIYGCMGEREQARSAFDSARVLLERSIKELPDDHRIHASLGRVYAGLGRKTEAIQHGRRSVKLFPVAKDAIHGPEFVENLASIYTAVGEYDAALDELEYLLSIPSHLSAASLRVNPDWDPIRDHPRFRALLAKHEHELAT
jgi:serine/threonine-protein kinase